MTGYIHRYLSDHIQKYLLNFPVVGLTGPRQAGKSTLLQHDFFKDYDYVSFDDRETLDLFLNDPKRFIGRYSHKVIFDEVQKAPKIFDDIKLIVDQNRHQYGQFILTGSCQFTMLPSITESLAGRIGLLTLMPLQYAEITEQSLLPLSLYKGGYPELVSRHYQFVDEWYRAYLTTYLERDVRQILNIGDLSSFHHLLKLLAAQVSQQLHLNKLATNIGVSVTTIKRWLHVLEASYIIFFIQPFYNNYGKRLTKSPKIYFHDPGLVAFLLRMTTEDLFHNGPFAGSLFENFVIAESKKNIYHNNLNQELYYLRTDHGVEIDLIIDKGVTKDLIEIKHSATFNSGMLKAIDLFREEFDTAKIIYTGKSFDYDQSIKAIHYHDYLLGLMPNCN